MNIHELARNALLAGVACAAFATPAAAQDAALLERLEALERKFEALEDENRTLKEELSELRETAAAAPAPAPAAAAYQPASADTASDSSKRCKMLS